MGGNTKVTPKKTPRRGKTRSTKPWNINLNQLPLDESLTYVDYKDQDSLFRDVDPVRAFQEKSAMLNRNSTITAATGLIRNMTDLTTETVILHVGSNDIDNTKGHKTLGSNPPSREVTPEARPGDGVNPPSPYTAVRRRPEWGPGVNTPGPTRTLFHSDRGSRLVSPLQ
ncbi:Hypp2861 [Branchiostoma lanceolatum]|uniref:Hypp2861 protein n=1 Tax=Branchiostoma lanceolatum TaxID=7740 RepID=A0A8J9ZWD6_BRALA|nr:Hypp2861 [Branchiostoma lanceolatum]